MKYAYCMILSEKVCVRDVNLFMGLQMVYLETLLSNIWGESPLPACLVYTIYAIYVSGFVTFSSEEIVRAFR